MLQRLILISGKKVVKREWLTIMTKRDGFCWAPALFRTCAIPDSPMFRRYSVYVSYISRSFIGTGYLRHAYVLPA